MKDGHVFFILFYFLPNLTMDPVTMHKLSWHDKVILPKTEPIVPKQTNQYVGLPKRKVHVQLLGERLQWQVKALVCCQHFLMDI